MHESRAAGALLETIEADPVIADKACERNAIRETVAAAGMETAIPSNRRRRTLIPHDATLYREHNLIERCFNKLMHFRRLATRHDRRALHSLISLCLAAAMPWIR